jgi:hypothetical protein
MSENQPQERPFGGFSGTSGYEGGLLDGSYYNAVVTGMKEVLIEAGEWPGWKVEWTFAIEGSGEEVRQLTSLATGEGSTAGPWLITLVGRQRYDERETQVITAPELVGRECLVLVSFSKKGWPRVGGVLPRQQAPAPVPQAVPAPVPAPVPVAAPREPANIASDFDDLPF